MCPLKTHHFINISVHLIATVILMVDTKIVRKDWWDEARHKYGVSAVDFDFVPIGDGKVVVKAKVATKGFVQSYGVVSEKDARSIGAAQQKAVKKALQFISGEFEKLIFDDEKPAPAPAKTHTKGYPRKGNGGYTKKYNRDDDRRVEKYPPNGEDGKYVCEVCGVEISPGVARYSMDKFGTYLCREHQQEAKEQ